MYWFLLKSIVSGIIGSAFGQWFLGTRVGIWSQAKLDRFMNYLSEKYDLDLMKKDSKWRKQYPMLATRIDKLEEWAHPPVAPGGATELKDEIEELRKEIKKLKARK